jgi:hypothetical protein
MTIIIDPEFRDLIQPMTSEERDGLAESIKAHGCRDPLTCWGDILLDGHNRYEICNQNDISYNIKPIKLSDRNSAKEWIIANQLNRRNLTLYQRSRLVLQRDEIIKARAKEHQGARTDLKVTSSTVVDDVKQASHRTDKQLAKMAGTSHKTIHEVRVIENEAPQEIKEKLARGETTINREYDRIRKPERHLSLTKKERIGIIRELSGQGYRAGQIAERVGVKEEHVRLLARESDIELPDILLRNRTTLDINRIISETVIQAQSLAAGLDLVDSRINDLDLSQIDGWVETLSKTISALNLLIKKLKRANNGEQNSRKIQIAG